MIVDNPVKAAKNFDIIYCPVLVPVAIMNSNIAVFLMLLSEETLPEAKPPLTKSSKNGAIEKRLSMETFVLEKRLAAKKIPLLIAYKVANI